VCERNGQLALDEVLQDLVRLDVQSVLVEGGARTIGGFLEAGLADIAALFVAGRLFGAAGATPLVDLPSVGEPAAGWRLERVRQLALGKDQLLLGRLVRPGEPPAGSGGA
jgi:diaminohydroxyphosphoribosylaminopyrimidine deaminase/5-amino-6-(5-phosphoribosylamino)uracil reductase